MGYGRGMRWERVPTVRLSLGVAQRPHPYADPDGLARPSHSVLNRLDCIALYHRAAAAAGGAAVRGRGGRHPIVPDAADRA